jgi:hypothetical protein
VARPGDLQLPDFPQVRLFIVDQALNAIAGTGPTVVETPTVLASKSDQALLDKLIKNDQP